jgi:hypothetical protein
MRQNMRQKMGNIPASTYTSIRISSQRARHNRGNVALVFCALAIVECSWKSEVLSTLGYLLGKCFSDGVGGQ